MDADGKNQKNLTNTNQGGCRSASWSPNGTKIGFMRDNPTGLYVMDADGRNQMRLSTHGDRDGIPSWSIDGKRLAYSDLNPPSIWVVNLGDKSEKRLIAGGSDPVWSPDGNSMLFVRRRPGGSHLCVVDDAGRNEAVLTKELVGRAGSAWSPDGSNIAFVARRAGRVGLGLVETKSKKTRRLAQLDVNPFTCFSWSPDGQRLCFVSGPPGQERLYVIDVDGNHLQEVAAGGTLFPAWRPGKQK
jgi:TolB protein